MEHVGFRNTMVIELVFRVETGGVPELRVVESLLMADQTLQGIVSFCLKMFNRFVVKALWRPVIDMNKTIDRINWYVCNNTA